MQQLAAEEFCRGFEVEALSRCVVVEADDGVESFVWQGCEVGLAWDSPSHSADGVLDGALLPRGVGVAEEGVDAEGVQLVVPRELGTATTAATSRTTS